VGAGGGGGGGETDAQRRARESNQEQFDYTKQLNEADAARQLADAEKTRQLELERQQRITTGLQKVDTLFKRYDNPKYYDKLKGKYVSAYLPQIQKQYQDAGQENLFNLARNGNLESSAAAKASGDLETQKGQQTLALRQRGTNYANTARTNAEARRSQLINQVYATADPTTVSAQGVKTGESATNFTADPQQYILPGMDYSPLGNLFTTAATGLNAYNQAQQYGQGGGGQVSSFLQRKTNEGKNIS
jgi:hypothetical protein